MKSQFLTDFKNFAMKGNVIDMAVGVIIGGAFGKIVTSLVNDVIMPAIGKLTGGVNFADLSYVLTPATIDPATGEETTAAVLIKYGAFIQNIVDFLIIAFCIFVAIRMLAKLKKKEEAPAPAAPPAPTKEELLLTEIRDLLKEKSGK